MFFETFDQRKQKFQKHLEYFNMIHVEYIKYIENFLDNFYVKRDMTKLFKST